LKRLGVTAIWVGPIFKQVAFQETYHGYGVQNFLDVEGRFGTREDLRTLVAAAHLQGIYVILDIILNHSGDVFTYKGNRNPHWTGEEHKPGREFEVDGFNDKNGSPTIPFREVDLQRYPDAYPDGAVWPAELQSPTGFTHKGSIQNWDLDPEYLEGDFADLKDINIGPGSVRNFASTPSLRALCAAYRFWIAYADLDGFRVDTVKHMGDGPTRYFASSIHEFATRLGKENFFLVGEVAGDRARAYNTVETTGIDAALGIADVQDQLENMIKGFRDPLGYFSLFRNSLQVRRGSHTWFRNKVVAMIDDHDQIGRGNDKARFCYADQGAIYVVGAIALNLFTLGIPCIYYGTEQNFDGNGGSDQYIREAMFGGSFGAFRSTNKHCFDETTRTYREVYKLTTLRKTHLALRRGRQYLRPISGDGNNFGPPTKFGDSRMRAVVAWSRIFADEELLCAVNTDPGAVGEAWVTVDAGIQAGKEVMVCLYSTAEEDVGGEVQVEERNGRAVYLKVPPGGVVVYM
jgi:glycosidase